MVGDLGEVLSGVLTVERFECVDDSSVQGDPACGRDFLVQRIAEQDVREAKSARHVGHIGDDAGLDRLIEKLECLQLRDARGTRKGRRRELAPEHGGENEQAPALVGKAGNAAGDYRAHALGNDDSGSTLLNEQAHHLGGPGDVRDRQ